MTVRHARTERDLVSMRIRGSPAPFLVPAEQRLLTHGRDGERIPCSTQPFVKEAVLL